MAFFPSYAHDIHIRNLHHDVVPEKLVPTSGMSGMQPGTELF